ncbi:MAG: hypothetical protein H6559_28375 [Lewinellaceae bacterium]|nr:hypothetical protein [Lewinellaceae bacterium]
MNPWRRSTLPSSATGYCSLRTDRRRRPWGVSYAANLTSDDTGIYLWTEAQFFRAIREGKYKGLEGSRPLLPHALLTSPR